MTTTWTWRPAWLVAVLVVLGLALAGIATAPRASADTAAQEPPPSETASFDGCPLLLEGQRSECVAQLQRKLNRVNSAYDLDVTGFFGPNTRIAVLDFQGRNHLPADGNVGQTTAHELDSQAGARSGDQVGNDNGDDNSSDDQSGSTESGDPADNTNQPETDSADEAGSEGPAPGGAGDEQPSTSSPSEQTFPNCPRLVEGQTSECVAQLQRLLNSANSEYGLPETGFFGPATREAVRDFQTRNGLPALGEVGPQTAQLLQTPTNETPDNETPTNETSEERPEPDGFQVGAVSENCGIATCSIYVSRSGTRSMDRFLDGKIPHYGSGVAATIACGAWAPVPYVGPALVIYCGVRFDQFNETLDEAAERNKCFKITYTNRKIPNMPPAVTHISTNNGDFCTD